MAIDRYTVEERYTKRTLKRGFTVYSTHKLIVLVADIYNRTKVVGPQPF